MATTIVLCTACDGPQSTLAPAGPAASYLAGLSSTFFVVLGAVYAD
jgi:hypothetical protein